MEEKQIMYFKDEEGNKVEFEAVARIFLNEETANEKEYLLLSPVVDSNEVDMYIFRVDRDAEGKEEYNLVEDNTEFIEVEKEYKKLLYNKE